MEIFTPLCFSFFFFSFFFPGSILFRKGLDIEFDICGIWGVGGEKKKEK